MLDRYFNCGGKKEKISLTFYIYDIVLLRTVCQFVKICLKYGLLVIIVGV